MASSSNNFRLNFLFLITILRLDITKTLAKPQDQLNLDRNLDQLFNDNVLIRDLETPTSSTLIITSEDFTRVTPYLDEANKLNEEIFTTEQTTKRTKIEEDNLNINRNISNVNMDKTIKRVDQEFNQDQDKDKHERSFTEQQTNNIYTTPRSTIRQIMTRHEWLSKEYFSYLCGESLFAIFAIRIFEYFNIFECI